MHRRSGSVAIEFAIIMAFIFPFLLDAFIEISFYSYERIVLTNAVRHGCRAGARVHPTLLYGFVAMTYTDDYLRVHGFRCPVTGCVESISTAGSDPQEVLQCSMNVPYQSILGLVPAFDGLPMKATYRVLFEYQR